MDGLFQCFVSCKSIETLMILLSLSIYCTMKIHFFKIDSWQMSFYLHTERLWVSFLNRWCRKMLPISSTLGTQYLTLVDDNLFFYQHLVLCFVKLALQNSECIIIVSLLAQPLPVWNPSPSWVDFQSGEKLNCNLVEWCWRGSINHVYC